VRKQGKGKMVNGSRQEIIPQYGEGFWFVIKAHSSAHIEICADGCNAEDGPKDKQDVELFFAEALTGGQAGKRRPGHFKPGVPFPGICWVPPAGASPKPPQEPHPGGGLNQAAPQRPSSCGAAPDSSFFCNRRHYRAAGL
jgi:hypothetical protein